MNNSIWNWGANQLTYNIFDKLIEILEKTNNKFIGLCQAKNMVIGDWMGSSNPFFSVIRASLVVNQRERVIQN